MRADEARAAGDEKIHEAKLAIAARGVENHCGASYPVAQNCFVTGKINAVTGLTFLRSANNHFTAQQSDDFPMKTTQLNRLCELENEIQALRQQLGVSARGEMIFQAPRSMWSATDVVVEADGRGGAKLMVVEGNYSADYTTHREEVFPTEDAACEAAERLVTPAKPFN